MAIDEFDHPDHGWKWRPCEIKWIETRIRSAILAEREACAKECDEIKEFANMQACSGGTAVDDGRSIGACECSDAIRGRGSKGEAG